MTAVFALCGVTSCQHTPTESPQSPEQAVEQFYKLETEGRWLGPEHWNELQDYVRDIPPWHTPAFVTVLKGYQIGSIRKDSPAHLDIDNYQVNGDEFVWGEIDSALHFKAGLFGKTSASGQPIRMSMVQFLSFSDMFDRIDPSGHRTPEKGNLRWRMTDLYPPIVNVDAARLWLTEERDKSSDPLIKYNAAKTIEILNSLSSGILPPTKPAGKPEQPASEVTAQFIALESRLTPDQWDQLARFFVETPKPKLDHVEVVDIVGTAVGAEGDKANAEVDFNSLGTLDTSMRLSKYPTLRPPMPFAGSVDACMGDGLGFFLMLSTEHWAIAKDGTVKELNGPLAWRVEYFAPVLSLDTAIRYVTQARDKTSDPAVGLNAVKTLRILNYYKRGKPLPDNLEPKSSGACG